MKIKSVYTKTVIVINGKEYERDTTDWTESVLAAQDEGMIENNNDIFNWIEIRD